MDRPDRGSHTRDGDLGSHAHRIASPIDVQARTGDTHDRESVIVEIPSWAS
jgi:hypothetical protein